MRMAFQHANVTKPELIALRDGGWKWSGHTHPGVADLVLDASGGDRVVLEIFGQQQSAITNSRGARNVFDRSDILGLMAAQ